MKKYTKQKFIIYIWSSLIFLLFINSFGQVSNADILDKQINLGKVDANIYWVCGILAAKGIPLGFEDIGYEGNVKNDKNIHVESGNLREILDSIVKQDSDYVWEIRDGVVNIYPARSRDRIIKEFLEINLVKFTSKKDEERTQITGTLYSSSEINNYTEFQKTTLTIFSKTNPYTTEKINHIEMLDTDLRGVLNKIVKESYNSKMWLTWRSENGEIILVF